MTDEAAVPSNWNLPNALTTLRILMVPFFAWALLVDDGTRSCGGSWPGGSSSRR